MHSLSWTDLSVWRCSYSEDDVVHLDRSSLHLGQLITDPDAPSTVGSMQVGVAGDLVGQHSLCSTSCRDVVVASKRRRRGSEAPIPPGMLSGQPGRSDII